jgi:hypothetical protein
MATRVEGPAVTIPAGTSQLAPLSAPLSIGESIVRRLDLIVPQGSSGLMGFYLAHSGTQMIPRRNGQYLILDDKFISFDMSGYPTGDKWTLVGYNTDVYDHTVSTIWHVDEIDVTRAPLPSIIPIG